VPDLRSTTRRRAFSLRLVGDDARYVERPGRTSPPFPGHDMVAGQRLREDWFPRLFDRGVDKTWGSCGAFSVCDGQPTIENCGPCDGYSVSPFGRPTHPPALSHAGIGNVID